MKPRKNEQLTNRIRMLLADILSREISDPRIADVVINRIELASDGSYAKVYVSSFTDAGDTGGETAAALRKASGYIRKLLSARLSIRTVPSLRFIWDESVKEGEQVLSLLRSMKSEED